MATFDFTRFHPEPPNAQGVIDVDYNVHDPLIACNFQDMVEDFMSVVRENPEFLHNHFDQVNLFCDIIMRDKYWHLATAVVPEFRKPQDYAPKPFTSLMDYVMGRVHAKRPQTSTLLDPPSAEKKKIILQQIVLAIEHAISVGNGISQISEEDIAELQRCTQGIGQILERYLAQPQA